MYHEKERCQSSFYGKSKWEENEIRVQVRAGAMLRACDEIGIYVMDELADMWERLKFD